MKKRMALALVCAVGVGFGVWSHFRTSSDDQGSIPSATQTRLVQESNASNLKAKPMAAKVIQNPGAQTKLSEALKKQLDLLSQQRASGVVPREYSVPEAQATIAKLEALRDQDAIVEVISYLDRTQDYIVQDRALEILTDLKVFEAMPVIITFADSKHDWVETQVLQSMVALGNASQNPADKALAFETMTEGLKARKIQASLNRNLQSTDYYQGIGLLKSPESYSFLLEKVVSERDLSDLTFIVQGLGDQGNPAALPTLREMQATLPKMDKAETLIELQWYGLNKQLLETIQKLESK